MTNKVFRPTKQTKRHENQLHSFVLFGVFRGQTFDTFCPVGVISEPSRGNSETEGKAARVAASERG